jgi:hypothetical protein
MVARPFFENGIEVLEVPDFLRKVAGVPDALPQCQISIQSKCSNYNINIVKAFIQISEINFNSFTQDHYVTSFTSQLKNYLQFIIHVYILQEDKIF